VEKAEAGIAVANQPGDFQAAVSDLSSHSFLPRPFTTVLSLFLDSVPQNEAYHRSYRFGFGRHGKCRYLHRMSKAGWEWTFQPGVHAVVFVC